MPIASTTPTARTGNPFGAASATNPLAIPPASGGIDASIFAGIRPPATILETLIRAQKLRAMELENRRLALELETQRRALSSIPATPAPRTSPVVTNPLPAARSVVTPPAAAAATSSVGRQNPAIPAIEGFSLGQVIAVLGQPSVMELDWRGVRTWYYRTANGVVTVYFVKNRATRLRPK